MVHETVVASCELARNLSYSDTQKNDERMLRRICYFLRSCAGDAVVKAGAPFTLIVSRSPRVVRRCVERGNARDARVRPSNGDRRFIVVENIARGMENVDDER